MVPGARSGKSLAGRAPGRALFSVLTRGLRSLRRNRGVERWDFSPGKEKDMAYVDQVLYCRDCNQEFTFTAGEQEFFASRALTNAPTRCPACRDAAKQAG